MATVKIPPVNDGGLHARVYMGGDSSSALVRAAVVQASTVFYNTHATLDKADKFIAKAVSCFGAELVVFPEAFIGGYPRGSTFSASVGNQKPEGKEDYGKYHASAINVPGPEVDFLAAMAAKYKVYLVMGVIERDGYTLYCTVLFFDSQGHYLGKHRKIVPPAFEGIIWGYGDGSTLPVYDTPIGKIGAVISWENRMPLLRTAMYAKGIEIYCAPTAAGVYCAPQADSWRDVGKESMTHIALEGGCFVLSASQFCRRRDYPPPPEYVFSGIEEYLTPDSVVCAGGSVVISPSGAVLAGPSYEGEEILYAVLDRGEIARAKLEFDVVGNYYGRPEILSLIVRDHPVSCVSFTSEGHLEGSSSKNSN